MTPEQFCYWLQGFVELSRGRQPGLTEEQLLIIADHLQLVFEKETPDRTEAPKADTERLLKEMKDAMRNRPNVTCSHDVRYC